MSFNEHSSRELASLASEALRDLNASIREKRLAASVLTQAYDRRRPQNLLEYCDLELAKLHLAQINNAQASPSYVLNALWNWRG